MAEWDPATYLRFADERGRPFSDLLARVGAVRPRTVVDLGCGPGQLTASLAERWPGAQIRGLDSSPAMIDAAAEHASDRVTFTVADLREWAPERPVDVIVSNATLQWVPGHRDQVKRLVRCLAAGGWIAFQVPGNFGEPSHRLLHALANERRYADHVVGLERPASAEPADYLADLLRLKCRADVWETTYHHVLPGQDAVFDWVRGTGARPILQALPDGLRTRFEAEYKARLREAYPRQRFGTVLPFRRIFAVAQVPGGGRAGPTAG